VAASANFVGSAGGLPVARQVKAGLRSRPPSQAVVDFRSSVGGAGQLRAAHGGLPGAAVVDFREGTGELSTQAALLPSSQVARQWR
jgi:hypothetical protein